MEPFISADDLAAYLETEIDAEALLTSIALDSACQTIRDYLGQDINLRRAHSENYDGTGFGALVLHQLPVIEVLQVFENDTELTVGTDYIVGDGGIIYRRGVGLPWWTHGWCMGRQNITVVYDHGWAIDESDVVESGSGDDPAVDRVPSDIRMVALELASRVLRSSVAAQTAGIVTSETIGDFSQTFDASSVALATQTSLLPEERIALNRYLPGV